MEQPKRLFDCLAYQLEHFPLDDMLSAKEHGHWKKYSTSDVQDHVLRISASLLAQGISNGDGTTEGRDKVAILSQNCPEWMMVDMAIQQIGAVSVPVYPTINNSELQFILSDAAVKLIFVGDDTLYRKVLSIQDALPDLQAIYAFKPVAGAPHWTALLADTTPEVAQRVQQLSHSVAETDLATILYTSGTTGTPKGVMLSHRNIKIGRAHV